MDPGTNAQPNLPMFTLPDFCLGRRHKRPGVGEG